MTGALAAVRITDVTMRTAGAASTGILADLGADVLKVEAGRYPDPWRRAGDGNFEVLNRNKRDISLDLKYPLGRGVFLDLVAKSDVVTDNFRRGTMDRLGLSFDELRRVQPQVVMVSFSSQGSRGPESDYGSLGSTLDALSGLMSITGHDADHPMWSSSAVNYPDQIASLAGAAAVMLGLRQRRRTGQAVRVDLAQREQITSMIGEVLLDYSVNGRIRQPRGNRDDSMVPHGVYRCAGDDAWVAIAVTSDAEWAALCGVMGRRELGDDPRFATLDARRARIEEIDALLSTWASGREKRAAGETLQAAGVGAAPVLDSREQLDDPHLVHRGFHRVSGTKRHRTFPFHLSRTELEIRRAAPGLGQDTADILRTLLGYSEERIAELHASGALATRASAASAPPAAAAPSR